MAVTLTAGSAGASTAGYTRPGGYRAGFVGAFGTLSAEPVAGKIVDSFFTSGGTTAFSLQGDTTSLGAITINVDGSPWINAATGTYNAGGNVTEYAGSGTFAATTAYSVEQPAGGPVTHATTGVLAGPGSTIAGAARYSFLGGTSYTPVPKGWGRGRGRGAQPRVVTSLEFNEASKLAWTDYFFEPASGPVTHAATGSLAGQGSSIAATSLRYRQFSSTGALIGLGASLAGVSARASGSVTHTTSGGLTGSGAAIAGVSARLRAFSSTGALVGQGSIVAGSSARFREFSTSGVLTGQGSIIAGSAARASAVVNHATSGTLTGQGSIVAGVSAHKVLHSTSGSLAGQGSTVAGSSARLRSHSTSGALTGAGSGINGTAARFRVHPASGALAGQGSSLAGSAARIAAPLNHATSGVLTGQSAILEAHSRIGASPVRPRGRGFKPLMQGFAA